MNWNNKIWESLKESLKHSHSSNHSFLKYFRKQHKYIKQICNANQIYLQKKQNGIPTTYQNLWRLHASRVPSSHSKWRKQSTKPKDENSSRVGDLPLPSLISSSISLELSLRSSSEYLVDNATRRTGVSLSLIPLCVSPGSLA